MSKESPIADQESLVIDSDAGKVGISTQKSRRRWVSGAGIGAVLLSMRSGSALAGGVCVSPSGFKSIEANPKTSHRPESFEGNCHSHGWYRGNPEKLGAYRYAKLKNYSLQPPAGSNLTADSTFESVVMLGGSYANARDLITVLADYLLGQQNVVTTLDVQYMWSRFYGGVAPAGSKFEGWSTIDIRAYLDVYVGDSSLPT